MALGKAPSNLTPNQQAKVEWIAKTDPRLYRAYKLKESLRLVFHNDTIEDAKEALDA
ncbi:MAG: transposase [Roseburia sp.]|nr:transposase [Roseburia sp.]